MKLRLRNVKIELRNANKVIVECHILHTKRAFRWLMDLTEKQHKSINYEKQGKYVLPMNNKNWFHAPQICFELLLYHYCDPKNLNLGNLSFLCSKAFAKYFTQNHRVKLSDILLTKINSCFWM